MFFAGTKMHIVTFGITAFEMVMLVIQVIYFLERPGDKRRLWYLILLVLLIFYNVCSGLFPDANIPIPLTVQTIIAYLVGFTMSMYVVYYFYRVFELRHLKFFVTYGLILFLFVPFIFLFVVPYLLTGNSTLSSKLTVVIPFFYGLSFIYCTSRALVKKFNEARVEGRTLNDPLYEHAIVAYISMLCWASLPVIVFFGDFQVLEHSVTNAGFMLMTIIYVRSAISGSRKEYATLLKSQQHLKDLNANLHEKVKERTKTLEDLNEQRTNTFINLAHETKTPLTLINNYLQEHIKKNGETEELNILKQNIQRLTSDMTNFFDVERINKGFLIYDHSHASDFTALLKCKLSMFELPAQKKGIVIDKKITENVIVQGNPSALDRIINNIVENAIRYTPEGGVIVASLFRDAGQVTLSISDSGRGIPEELQKKVFEPYFQLGDKRRNHEGMGMGLSIVKKVIDDLKGTIQLISEEGKGTTVLIKLKTYHGGVSPGVVVTSDDISLADQTQVISDRIVDQHRPCIMLIEDNGAMLTYLTKKLSDHYNLAIARNGSEALCKLKTLSRLDLIISDIMMNQIDGIEVCKILSRNQRLSHIPLIFLSAKCTAKDKALGLKAGAIDFLEKPFNIEQLLVKVESILAFTTRQRVAIARNDLSAITAEDFQTAPDTSPFELNCKRFKLSAREVEIVGLIMKGLPYKQIAEQLFISVKTVNAHAKNIFDKCQVNCKVELINRLTSPLILN
jgi:signal transduction histidine kinase/DNA-binding NarL/FixJ family response regulator